MAVDTVLIRAIRLEASLGILPWERQVRQPVEVDVDAEVDTSALLGSGDLTQGVDFSVVIESVRGVVQAGHIDLVEVMADRIASAVLRDTPARRVRVQVRKYSACAGAAAHVGVEVWRDRQEA
jgi:dihydroneopterin aldolase